AAEYKHRREIMLSMLEETGFDYFKPSGAYYIFSDISKFGFEDDLAMTRHLVKEVGVAVVPGSSFFADKEEGRKYIRFCFSRRDETLAAARQRLLKAELKVG
ncbi:MAG TPA: aminotransferase class I/II-fold pyridoxal phosphate-dependent enzyme, partial [Candidatus Melainabacteria bacterium]|nr:aminotransferase class I/II-fold pyridoxal phosphate-dependent enzyme [Candidatus Melainabacteria bacterium]